MRFALRAAALAAIVAGPAFAQSDVVKSDANRSDAAKPAPDAPQAQQPQAQQAPQASQGGQPDVATLLFSGSQWKAAPAGSVLTYDYAKKTGAAFGPSFEDHVVLTLDKGDGAGTRSVVVKMFSGGNAKPAGPFDADEQNPVLLLVLEENVQEMSQSFHANPRYLKNAIRKAWREAAAVTPVTLQVDGRSVEGTRITVEPFKGDPQADRMKGLETITYTIDVSDAVPGTIAAIDIHAPAQGQPTFSETLRYQGIKMGIKQP